MQKTAQLFFIHKAFPYHEAARLTATIFGIEENLPATGEDDKMYKLRKDKALEMHFHIKRNWHATWVYEPC